MSSTGTSAFSTKAGRCGLTRSELKEFNWVTEEGRCKALCEDGSNCGDPYSKHAETAAAGSTKQQRLSGGSDSSHDSQFDQGNASVFIDINNGQEFCNGTLIIYRTAYFVCTSAHALVDKNDMSKLKPNIQLLLTPLHQAPCKLRWTRALHSFHRFNWKADERATPAQVAAQKDRQFDVLMFELDPTGMEEVLDENFRKLWTIVNSSHSTVCGLVYRPSLYDPPNLVHEEIRAHITGRGGIGSTPLAHLDVHIAIAGSSGTGLMDRNHLMQACIVSVGEFSPGAPRTIVVLAKCFETLYANAHKKPPLPSEVKVVPHPHSNTATTKTTTTTSSTTSTPTSITSTAAPTRKRKKEEQAPGEAEHEYVQEAEEAPKKKKTNPISAASRPATSSQKPISTTKRSRTKASSPLPRHAASILPSRSRR